VEVEPSSRGIHECDVTTTSNILNTTPLFSTAGRKVCTALHAQKCKLAATQIRDNSYSCTYPCL
jgi:hypothetical protein